MVNNQFKTGQEVLVRDDEDSNWEYGLYSHYCKNWSRHRVNSSNWVHCIPYKGNEHLVGTTDKPKEDLPINTPVMCYDVDTEEWTLKYYAGHNYTFCHGKSYECNSQRTWDYIIPVDEFDFNDSKKYLRNE